MAYICPVCSNKDKDYFFYLNGKLHCRKCINFVGEKADKTYKIKPGYFSLSYKLTDLQQKASDFILENILLKRDCAINAVCGAGKTEIIYDCLKYCLNNDLKVGIAIPRKDVVIELAQRIEKDFNVKVIPVYGGNHKLLEGDIIVFTTHQSFRYIGYFDVLIIDEIDAFPYKGNEKLKQIIKKCSSRFIYLSATMPKYVEQDKQIQKFYLNRRYHGFDLPIPKCIESFSLIRTLKKKLKALEENVVIVYFPTIKIQMKVAKKIKCDFLINSKTNDREIILSKIRGLSKGVIFATTVLERGITIKNVQVIVYNADNSLFDKDALIQISGRVGRSKDFPSGNIFFICKIKNRSIKGAIKTLKKCNE